MMKNALFLVPLLLGVNGESATTSNSASSVLTSDGVMSVSFKKFVTIHIMTSALVQETMSYGL